MIICSLIITQIVELEDLLNGCASMAIERTADDYKVFAFERGYEVKKIVLVQIFNLWQ